MRAPHGVARDVEQKAQTRRLRRLQRDRADEQPTAAAVHDVAEARDQHDREQPERDHEQQPVRAVPELRRHRRRDEHADEPDTYGRDVPCQIHQRLARLPVGDRNRRRPHHDRADRKQRDERSHQHGVECSAARFRDCVHSGSPSAARANKSPRSL